MKTQTYISDLDILQYEYLPVDQFIELIQSKYEVPYKSSFSFGPYLKSLKSKMSGACNFTKAALAPILENGSKQMGKNIDEFEHKSSKEFDTLLSMLMPSMFFDDQKSMITPPFTKKFLFRTDPLEELFFSGKWEIKINPEYMFDDTSNGLIQAGSYILQKVYNKEVNVNDIITMTLRNRETLIEKHFQMKVRLDFVNVKTHGKLNEISDEEVSQLINDFGNIDLWLEKLPPDNFSFEGFSIATIDEITEIEIQSQIKDWLNVDIETSTPAEYIEKFENQLRSYIQSNNVKAGMIFISHDQYFRNDELSLTGINDLEELQKSFDRNSSDGLYHRVGQGKEAVFQVNMEKLKLPSQGEQLLLEKGIKSVILYPLYDAQGHFNSIVEIGSPDPYLLNALLVRKLKEVFELLTLTNMRFSQELDNSVGQFIQNKFTSIHPSVFWKFEDAATKYQIEKAHNEYDPDISPIVFNDVFPLYGQADVVGSSLLRNNAIQNDLIKNLNHLLKLMDNWLKKRHLHLLASYQFKIKAILDGLKDEFISSDESRIVNLLTEEIHPLLDDLAERFPKLNNKTYREYKELLDPNLGIVYNLRRQFEESVSHLIAAISQFVEDEDLKMQKVLPHYFEKYKTDGVEYNMYLGQSLLKSDKYSDNDLKNFRLWQLEKMVDLTRLVAEVSPKLDVPLETAQLIFVYNNSLSIRFRMDEKKFDVDGAYNVRYEILKKRIDKAVIKGTTERLTLSGKIAIVYLQDKDKTEYLDYLDYLSKKGVISPEIEELELEKLQGAEGLKALRVSVLNK